MHHAQCMNRGWELGQSADGYACSCCGTIAQMKHACLSLASPRLSHTGFKPRVLTVTVARSPVASLKSPTGAAQYCSPSSKCSCEFYLQHPRLVVTACPQNPTAVINRLACSMEQPLPDFSQLKDQIWEEVRRAIKFSNQTEGFWENVQAFMHAVDWRVGAVCWTTSPPDSLHGTPLTQCWSLLCCHAGTVDQGHIGWAHGHLLSSAAVPPECHCTDRCLHVSRYVHHEHGVLKSSVALASAVVGSLRTTLHDSCQPTCSALTIRGCLAASAEHGIFFMTASSCVTSCCQLMCSSCCVYAAFAGSLVYFGENINSVAGQHWQSFATQDYFDEHGVFYNTIVSGPALITLLTVLVRNVCPAAAAGWFFICESQGSGRGICCSFSGCCRSSVDSRVRL